MVSLASKPEHWNTTVNEQAIARLRTAGDSPPRRTLTRAMDVDAPADVVFRWVCQLTVAPYSYDWLNNLGRQSPRQLTDGADELVVGQRFLSLRIDGFEPGRMVGVASSASEFRIFGVHGFSYRVVPGEPARSRILVEIDVQEPRRLWQAARHAFLAWGDLIMIRKQLRTLRALAEAHQAQQPTSA